MMTRNVASFVNSMIMWSGTPMQALPKVQGEPRRGRTPAEEQLWLQLHDRFAMEAQELEKLVRLKIVFTCSCKASCKICLQCMTLMHFSLDM